MSNYITANVCVLHSTAETQPLHMTSNVFLFLSSFFFCMNIYTVRKHHEQAVTVLRSCTLLLHCVFTC